MSATFGSASGMTALRVKAPAKVNLCLFLGPARPDGRHELVTMFESLTLCDELELVTLEAGADQVNCAGVEGPNLVAGVLGALRREGWRAPPVRIDIRKRIPVAAGLGGGSADAAAALRLAHALHPLPDGLAERLARELGADVPAQLRPGLSLGTGAGEVVQPLEPLAPHALVIVPQPFGLSTADVYREADRLGLGRSQAELERLQGELLRAAGSGDRTNDGSVPPVLPDELLVNDLEPAAVSLAPPVGEALNHVRQGGAHAALLCGSGPTVAGLWWGPEAPEQAAAAAPHLKRYPGTTCSVPWREDASSRCATIDRGP